MTSCVKNRGGREMRQPGLKPALTLRALRGAEAPLFHGASGICEFLRSLMREQFKPIRIFCPLLIAAMALSGTSAYAQGGGYERTFPQSKAVIEKVLKEVPLSGRLPVLEGFATAGEHPLDRYRRGYYQSKVQVTAAPDGGSVVHVSVEVTAWYADPVAAKSGYQLLPSNGRLETDLLDQLGDQLSEGAIPERPSAAPTRVEKPVAKAAAPPQPALTQPRSSEPTVSAPVPRLPEVRGNYSASLAESLDQQRKDAQKGGSKKSDDKDGGPLQTEANSLEEILKNQANPKNLVAVKKSGTPVVASASLNAKTLFLASAHDEFEMLDFNRDWVHVRVSGLSRGWIWRNNLELPDSVPQTDAAPAPLPAAAEMFHVAREEIALFPGDWAPLRGMRVKIVSVEKTDDSGKDSGPALRLEFTKSVLEKDYAELSQKSQELAGIVLIFDSVDGGMIAATFATLQQWKAGKLSDAALRHQCFFDPPEIFTGSGSSAGSE